MRIALEQAGLDADSATGGQVAVVLEGVLPSELTRRGIEDADGIRRRAADRISSISVAAAGPDTPEAVFQRLRS